MGIVILGRKYRDTLEQVSRYFGASITILRSRGRRGCLDALNRRCVRDEGERNDIVVKNDLYVENI